MPDFIGEKLVQRIVRDLALKAMSVDACTEIGNNFGNVMAEMSRNLGSTLGIELRKAVERITLFQSLGEDMDPETRVKQLLSEGAHDQDHKVCAVGGIFTNLLTFFTTIYTKLVASGISIASIEAFIIQAIPLVKAGDWTAFVTLLLSLFTPKPAEPVGPVSL